MAKVPRLSFVVIPASVFNHEMSHGAFPPSLSLRDGFTSDEIQQDLRIGFLSLGGTISNELVVIHHDLNDGVANPPSSGDFSRAECCPLIIGLGEFQASVPPKSIVIFATNDGNDKSLCHVVRPEVESTRRRSMVRQKAGARNAV